MHDLTPLLQSLGLEATSTQWGTTTQWYGETRSHTFEVYVNRWGRYCLVLRLHEALREPRVTEVYLETIEALQEALLPVSILLREQLERSISR